MSKLNWIKLHIQKKNSALRKKYKRELTHAVIRGRRVGIYMFPAKILVMYSCHKLAGNFGSLLIVR